MAITIVITLIAILGALVAYFIKRSYSYWERMGIPYIPPSIPHGNFREIGTTFQGEIMQKMYRQMKGKDQFFGMYLYNTPIILALDLEFVKNVLIKDFQYFHDRGFYYNEKDDPLSAHLFSIEGTKWKNIRNKLTPTFTSGKMKYMYPTVLATVNQFKGILDDLLIEKDSVDIEIKDLLARYGTDVIGRCAFGIECNSLNDSNSEIRKMGKEVFEKRRLGAIGTFLTDGYPNLARFLGIKLILDNVEKYFMGIVRKTVEYREKSGVSRNDFMDLLLKLRNSTSENLTMNELAAQCFVFFLGGFETSSTVMTFAFYELASNKDVQGKARKEVQEALKKHGELSYEAMMDMTYITQILNESMRKYSPAPVLLRTTTKDYHVPNSKHVLKKGTKVWIPIHAIHRDPDNYSDPERFDPDRFSTEEMNKRDSISFLPFGDGPRICIGMRFGLMQSKIGLATLLLNFEFSLCSKSMVPLRFDPKSFNISPDGGMWLNMKRI